MTDQIRSIVYSNLFAVHKNPEIMDSLKRWWDANVDIIESLPVRGNLITMFHSSYSSQYHHTHTRYTSP